MIVVNFMTTETQNDNNYNYTGRYVAIERRKSQQASIRFEIRSNEWEIFEIEGDNDNSNKTTNANECEE